MLQTRKRHPCRVETPRMANYSEFPLPRAHDKQRNYWQRLTPFFYFKLGADIKLMLFYVEFQRWKLLIAKTNQSDENIG